MIRRKFITSTLTGGVCFSGLLALGAPSAKRWVYRTLSRIDVNSATGMPPDPVVRTMASLAGVLAGDFDSEAVSEALRPWIIHHAEQVPGWLDKYTTGAAYLDSLAFRSGKRTFLDLTPSQAVQRIAGVLGQTDQTRRLLTPMARERWYLKQTLCEHLRIGWSRSRRAWEVVGYGNLVPGSYPGARAYTQPPELTRLD